MPLFILCACCINAIVADCVVGDFQKSKIDGSCPDGMTVVTRRDVCEGITIVNGKSVQFDNRDISCTNLHKVPFGCYFYGEFPVARIKFNSKENAKCSTMQTANTEELIIKASICECTPTTTTTLTTTTSLLVGCEGQGKIYKSSFCPDNTYNILSEDSCRKSAKRLNRIKLLNLDEVSYQCTIISIGRYFC